MDMAKTEVKHPDKEAKTGSYSAGLLVDGWLYVSGHASEDLRTGNIIPGTIEEQTTVALTHIGEVLKAAGASFADVVRCTCYLSDITEFSRFDHAYAKFFPAPLPTRSTVQVVLSEGLKVEIDAVARVKP
jgi:2-iminobutanoate/2-iminopropanoate deaminase